MSNNLKFGLLACAALSLALAGPAGAQIVSGTITGSVTDNSLGVSGVNVGDAVSGTYSYDSSMLLPDGLGRDGNPLTEFTLQIGSFSHIFTLTDLQTNLFSRERIPAFSMPPVDSLEFFFDFNALLTNFGSGINQQSIGNGIPQNYAASSSTGTLAFGFRATSSDAAVPEPGSIAMISGMGIAGSMFAVSRLRRRKR